MLVLFEFIRAIRGSRTSGRRKHIADGPQGAASKAKVDPSFAPFGHSAVCFVRTSLCLGSNDPFLATIHTTRSLIESHLPIVVIFNANWELGRRNSRAALAANRKHAPPQPERPINPTSESSRSRRFWRCYNKSHPNEGDIQPIGKKIKLLL